MTYALRHIRRHAIAYLALFVTLAGGTAVAAEHLGKNSVGTKQLKSNAVVSGKVKNHSLRSADFKPGQLPRGPRGLAGSAQAYAYVNPGGTGQPSFDAGRTRNFTGVSKKTINSQTFYCLTPAEGVDLGSTVAAVTPVSNSGFAGSPQQAYVVIPDDGNCGSAELEVVAEGTFAFTVVVP